MEFEINVAENGKHYFRVIVPYGKVKKVYTELQDKFPNCELTVTQWERVGKSVDIDNCTF